MRRTTSRDVDWENKLDSVERTTRERKEHRRAGRGRRRRSIIAVVVVFLALVVLAGPSLICHSPLSRTLLRRAAAEYGWDAQADSLQLGWITPLRATGLRMQGHRAGTVIEMDELQSAITIMSLWSGDVADGKFGDVVIRGVVVEAAVGNAMTSIEQDLTDLLAGDPSSPAIVPVGSVTFQDLTVRMTDSPTRAIWAMTQSHGEMQLSAREVSGQIAGIVTQPGGGEGGYQASAKLPASFAPTPDMPMSITLTADSLPLSILSLVQRRFPEQELPADVSGDLTGQIEMRVASADTVQASLRDVRIRNLLATSATTRQPIWQNQLASMTGDVVWRDGRIIANQFVAGADFGEVSVNGSFSDSLSLAGATSNPLVWLDQVDATARGSVDLVRFQSAFPGVLPIKQAARLTGGRIEATIQPAQDERRDAVRRRRLMVTSTAIEASSPGGPIRIAPVDFVAIVASDVNRLTAEEFRLDSPFATVNGRGDLESGNASGQIDFGKLARMVRPLIESDGLDMDGSIDGQIQWNVNRDGIWRLRGDGRANHIAVTTPDGRRIAQNAVQTELNIVGRWATEGGGRNPTAGGRLSELTQAQMRTTGDGIKVDVELERAITNFDASRALPLRIRAEGQIEPVMVALRPWLPEGVSDIRGGFRIAAQGQFSGDGRAILESVDGQLTQLSVPGSQTRYEQDRIAFQFDGKATYPEQDVVVGSLTITGEAASAGVQGEWIGGVADLEIAFRADLDRLQASGKSRVADRPGNQFQTASATTPVAGGDWSFAGDVEGKVVVTGDLENLNLDLDATATKVNVREPVGSTVSSFNRIAAPTSNLIWSEPRVSARGTIAYASAKSTWNVSRIELASQWFAATLTGVIEQDNSLRSIRLNGPAKFKMDAAAERLTQLTGTQIAAEGIHETPLDIQYAAGADNTSAFTIGGTVGWETVDAAGMLFGPSTIPFRMTESKVMIQPSRVPVLGVSRLVPARMGPQVPPLSYDPNRPDQWQANSAADAQSAGATDRGELWLAGQVQYRPDIWVQLDPGPIARNIQLTPEMTDKWLKYIAPIASDAARVEGTFGADLDEAIISIDQPRRSRVKGRLNIEQVRMNAGPLADQVIASARRLQSLAAIGSSANPPRTGQTLVTLPAQVVDFNVSDGMIQHRALMMQIDRARVVTSGAVTMDGGLNLTAQIPLDASWLGSDLRGLAGQQMTLPIDGTLSRPSLDSAGLQRAVSDIGLRAAQEAGGNFLQQQIGRGQQQLEDGLYKGIEKLGIEKLFGR